MFKYSITFVLQQTSEASKPTPLRAFVRFNNTRAVFTTRLRVEPRYWNKKAQEPRQAVAFKDAKKLASALKEIRAAVELAFVDLTEKLSTYPSPQELKLLVLEILVNGGQLPGTKKIYTGLFPYMEQLIANTKNGKRVTNRGKKYQLGTVKHYTSALGVLKRYAKFKAKDCLRFEDITLDFYYELKDFCYLQEEFTDNYFGAVIKVLKTCMSEAQIEKLHNNEEYKSKRFVKVVTDVDNVYLNRAQLQHLLNFDFSDKPRLAKARDLFLVGCWTGLRFSDFTKIEPGNIIGDYIEIKTQKTGELVAIPIHDDLRVIMARYEGKTPSSLPPAISNVKLNAYIKEVAKEAGFIEIVYLEKAKSGMALTIGQPMWELISTHTARRAFASNMFLMGVPTIAIMAVTGHRTEKAFLNYIKVSPKEKAEIMREVWSRQSMRAV